MIPATTFELGERVRLSRSCPIDFEGIGPLPGDLGEIVELPVKDDERHETGVRFERVSARWEIPSDYLEHTS